MNQESPRLQAEECQIRSLGGGRSVGLHNIQPQNRIKKSMKLEKMMIFSMVLQLAIIRV